VIVRSRGAHSAHRIRQRLYTRGGPYFTRPETIVDHVGLTARTRDALVLLPKVRRLLPRGARGHVFEPGNTDTMPDFFAGSDSCRSRSSSRPAASFPNTSSQSASRSTTPHIV